MIPVLNLNSPLLAARDDQKRSYNPSPYNRIIDNYKSISSTRFFAKIQLVSVSHLEKVFGFEREQNQEMIGGAQIEHDRGAGFRITEFRKSPINVMPDLIRHP
jgi:hypothetical protein